MSFRVALIAWLLPLLQLQPALSQEPIWSDEFNGKVIDRGTWTFDVGGHGFGNGQLEFDTARRENSYLKDGHLVIEARREPYEGKQFTSARMLTQGRFAFRYGTLEARIKLPNTANGIWPAFWMLGNNFPAIDWPRSGEVDILEIGSKEGIAEGLQARRINCALHFAGKKGVRDSRVSWFDAPTDLHQGFHRYKVTWTPQRITFQLDDHEFGSWEITADEFREFHQPHFVLLNVAVGGWDGSYTSVDTPEKVTADFPARMYVDWIRLYPNDHTEVILGSASAEDGPFGVFTEREAVKTHLSYTGRDAPDFDYGKAAARLTWNNMPLRSKADPSEGLECWNFEIQKGSWFGTGVFLPNHRNLTHYSDGYLHFDIRTESNTPLKVGIKSSRGGEFWLPVGDESSEFGFQRDGEWHTIVVPLSRFANIDFETVHQMFMLSGDAPDETFTLAVDNIWWQPSVARPRPAGKAFAVFSEEKNVPSFRRGQDGDFFVWEKTLVEAEQDPYEGERSLSLKSASGSNWSGAAFTPNVKHDLRNFQTPSGRLRFAMRTRSRATFRIGMKSGTVDGVGQWWLTFRDRNDPYGFARDGAWHVVEIPLLEVAEEVDLSQVSQLFQVLSTGEPLGEIEFDDIRFTTE